MKVNKELYKVKINSDGGRWGEITEEEFLKLQEVFLEFDFLELSKFNKEKPEIYHNKPLKIEEYILTGAQISSLAIKNIKFEVVQEVKVDIDITDQLISLAEKPIKLIQENGSNTYNSKCEVHMPGHSLSIYNETMLIEDSCTDSLQSNLNSGWRIIAACPQPDQRRPDYILGRFNPSLDINGSAERG